MKKNYLALGVMVLFAMVLAGCGTTKQADNKKIVIWTSAEDFRIDHYLKELKKKYPNYEIVMEYMNSSAIAAKVIAEGENCTCDIICSEEYGYLDMCGDKLAVLDKFDFSPFMKEIVPASRRYTPELKNGGCVILNREVLQKKGARVPNTYAELLKAEYKNLLSMPNPASSGTGYMFLKQFVNEWGEDKAFDYFNKFTGNVLQYTSSGSGPVKALVQGEVGVGLGMTAQAVQEIKKGAKLDIVFFKEGSPFSMYGNAVLAHKANREKVMDVFNYLSTELAKQNNTLFFPDQIYTNYAPELDGFPKNIHYGNMMNDTRAEKERLLKKWTF